MSDAIDLAGRCPTCGGRDGRVRLPLEWPDDVDAWPPGTVSEWSYCLTHSTRWRDMVVTTFSSVLSSFAEEIRMANDEATAECVGLEGFAEIELPEYA